MKNFLIAFIFLVLNASIYAQTTSNTIFTNGDRINIELSENSGFYYVHELEKGQSLYALSKIFDIPLSMIYRSNNIKEGAILDIGQKIKILIKHDYLFKGTSLEGLKYGHYIPVYYQTKPKDNLFRISRIFFSQPTEDLIKRNKLQNNNLSLGQDILIGWWPIERTAPIQSEDEFVEELETTPLTSSDKVDKLKNIIESTRQSMEDVDVPIKSNIEAPINSPINSDIETPIYTQIDTTESEYPQGFNMSLLGTLKYSDSMKEVKKWEVAHWDKSMTDNGMVYVLHSNAIIDSYISMYNPVLRRSVKAKVIGRIPYGAYTKDVSLVLSPSAAIQLGAQNNRFKVEVNALFHQNDSSDLPVKG